MPVKKKPAPQLNFDLRCQSGIRHPADPNGGLYLHYEHPHGNLYCGDSVAWLKGMATETVDITLVQDRIFQR
jgi:hypothetical protein